MQPPERVTKLIFSNALPGCCKFAKYGERIFRAFGTDSID